MQVLVFPGMLTYTNFAHPKVISNGGPLGDMSQWADLIAGLHVLEHHVVLRYDRDRVVDE